MLNRYKYQCRTYPTVGKSKPCYTCKVVKDFGLFVTSKSLPDGCSNQCKECESKRRSKHIRIPDVEKDGVLYRVCRHCEKKKSLEGFKNQPRGLNGKQRICKDCDRILAKERGYYSREKRHARESVSPQSKMRRILRTRVACALIKYKQHKITKAAKTLDMLGCDMDSFVRHLESFFQPGMTWGNHGSYQVGGPITWHVDHTRPCDMFDLTDPEQQKACFHYTNLRPMWATENLQKGNKLCHVNM